MVRLARATGAPALLVSLVYCLATLAGCSSGGAPAPESDALSGSDLAAAQGLYNQVVQDHSQQRDDQVLTTTNALVTRYPTFQNNDVALDLAIDAASRLGQTDRALALTDLLVADYPRSERVDPALARGASWAASAGDSLRGAGYLVELYDRDPAGQTGPEGYPLAAQYFEALDLPDLTDLTEDHRDGGVYPFLQMLRIDHLMMAGQVADAEAVVAELEKTAPENVWTLASRQMLLGGTGWAALGAPAEVRMDLVGVVCPLTGRYAVLGNAFYEAALLAVTATNAELGTAFELKVEDSEGDPVAAALAARRLCRDEGSAALVGAMMSDPTATVAVVADHWQVPLVSPTATNDRIWEIGAGVFQTNLTGLYETRMLAALATTVMLKKRFGILYPDTPEGRGQAEVFRNQVEELGGDIVVQVAFPARGTDFKDSILEVRQERPEVLFVPASVDQMVLIGPQLDFYKAGSLVLGLSNWNSEKLRERSGTVLERAIFPNALALFPAQWTAEFRSRWDGANYPREATSLALKTYQATRMLLDTLGGGEISSRLQLTHALKNRLANRDFEAEGPESFARTTWMFRDQEIVPFPGTRFAEAWRLTEGAAADSLAIDPEPGVETTVPANGSD